MTKTKWNTLTRAQKHAFIAEACGAKWYRLTSQDALGNPERSLSPKSHGLIEADGTEVVCQIHRLPNYTTDLNAMHRVEESMTDDHAQRYSEELILITGAEIRADGAFYGVRFWNIYHATAAQRAEAFALTVEEKK